MPEHYIEVTREAGAALFARNIQGEIVMLNLLRFNEVADYTSCPELAPDDPVSGRAAYECYIDHTLPFLTKSGGEVLFSGKGGRYVIGPMDEPWDHVLLVRHKSLSAFMTFASNEGYLKGAGHRTAALLDSRLLPIVEDATVSGSKQ